MNIGERAYLMDVPQQRHGGKLHSRFRIPLQQMQDYRDGGRYPDLERDPSKPDILSEIASARATRP